MHVNVSGDSRLVLDRLSRASDDEDISNGLADVLDPANGVHRSEAPF